MQLEKQFDSKKIEKEIKDYLSNIDLHKMIFESSEKIHKIMFIEGPPTMNGIPHAGHLRGRVIKDLWYRYMTLKGNKVVFNAGWDTQGLPIELQAEKELGVSGGKTEIIKSIGIEKLVSECKKLVQKYNAKWVEADNLLGMSFNQKDAYWTFRDDFIEREWQFLRKAHENGILEEDYTVIAYCPSCQTSLSHAEVNQGYDMVKDPSLYYKVKLQDENIFLIVWTTMPFTLVTDAMVGLNPEENYVFVKVNDETWVVGEKRLEELMIEIKVENYSKQKTVKGKDLEGKRYIHPLLGQIPGLDECAKESNYHITVAEEFVDANTGSGLVHLSPANAEEEIKIANKRGVRIFNPIDDEVKFKKEAGKYEGLFVRDADEKVVEDLRDANALVKIGKIKHKNPLLGIIKEKHPWCISRERFWGCPLPIWDCKDCGKQTLLFSRKEIVDAASVGAAIGRARRACPSCRGPEEVCAKCGSVNTHREEYVLDTWHNSGSAPYSSLTNEEYSSSIPAPFLTEGIDQTRGWAYTLLIENVILNNGPVPPYKSFLFQGHVLDKNGNKMSKSLGNVIDAKELLTKYPVDLIRFYFMWKSSPIEPLNFSTEELMSRPYQVLSTLYHLHLYFKQNSEYDKFDESKTTLQWAQTKNLLQSSDIWLLSKLQKLIQDSNDLNDKCKFHEAARALDDFIINSLSQIYIPITRVELWDEEESKKDRRFSIYAVLHEILKTLDILLHPLCPFTSEYLYQTTFAKKKSILLDSWPKVQESLISENIEASFDLLKEVVSVSAAARMKGKLKRRWPLNEALICIQKSEKTKLESLSNLLKSQLNVEKYTIFEIEIQVRLRPSAEHRRQRSPWLLKIELDRKKIGPKAKQLMGALLKKFSETNPIEIVSSLQKESKFTFDIEGNKISLEKDDFVIDFEAKKGFAVAKRDGFVVFISTERNAEMMARGLIKDLARRLQTLRKERGYNPTDILNKASILDLDPESLEMVTQKAQELAFLVRVKEVNFKESCKLYKDDDIDGQKIRISVE